MSEFFKSAMGYFNNTPSGTSNGSEGGGGPENDFVGQLVEVGSMNLRIRKLIAEG